ncbi:MAG: GIY-YIG nuclease family protein [Candidatus Magasanikbacteria bacterium]|nr:GIY-YIG nuclease family protein [Candidatus Magasanikbacteria bacterium]
MPHFVYILKCADKTLYTGCTNNLKKRLHEHNTSKAGAKYTRARRPVKLVYTKKFRALGSARKYEAEIKRLTRKEKLVLIKKSSSLSS